MRIYDPCSGSGGMLILSKEYVDEHGGNPRNLGLYGQETNGGVWAICKMNMLLHGIPDADIQQRRHPGRAAAPRGRRADALRPRHHQSAVLARTTRRDGMPFHGALPLRLLPGERQEGRPDVRPAHARRAAAGRHGGHGHAPRRAVPRRRREARSARGFLDDGSARGGDRPRRRTCSTAPASPPASSCCARQGAKPPERRGKVLFINADREYYEGRAQNYLLARAHREDRQRLRALRGHPRLRRRRGPRRARARTTDNLNIRRYADNAPPPEPHDVRAHLLGGVPKAEVEAQAALFEAHGFDPTHLLPERDEQLLRLRRHDRRKGRT